MSKTTQHKEGQATVSVLYKVGKTLADGSHPFLIRITKNRQQVYRSTGLSLHPKYWNAAKHEVRRSYPEELRKRLLADLDKWKRKYSEAAESLAGDDERHDANAVRCPEGILVPPEAVVGQPAHAVPFSQRFGQAESKRRVIGPRAGGLMVRTVSPHARNRIAVAGRPGLELYGHTQGVANSQANQGRSQLRFHKTKCL